MFGTKLSFIDVGDGSNGRTLLESYSTATAQRSPQSLIMGLLMALRALASPQLANTQLQSHVKVVNIVIFQDSRPFAVSRGYISQ